MREDILPVETGIPKEAYGSRAGKGERRAKSLDDARQHATRGEASGGYLKGRENWAQASSGNEGERRAPDKCCCRCRTARQIGFKKKNPTIGRAIWDTRSE